MSNNLQHFYEDYKRRAALQFAQYINNQPGIAHDHAVIRNLFNIYSPDAPKENKQTKNLNFIEKQDELLLLCEEI